TQAGGWDAEVYGAADGPPDDLDGWEGIGEVTGAGEQEAIGLEPPGPASYFLLWFKTLPESTETAGRYRAEVTEIELSE
ncbi:MAG TPA: hypothetical protein VK919_14615, partial [Solirubrobacterales bacterium]|nr:hypothetical protein [Solirubrobacterales bacterium]